MPKPPLERLDLAAYPAVYQTAPRFGDVDRLKHINNAALVRIYEDAHVRFLNASGVRNTWAPDCRLLVAEITVQYLAEGLFPEALTIGCGVSRIGRSSFCVAQALFQKWPLHRRQRDRHGVRQCHVRYRAVLP